MAKRGRKPNPFDYKKTAEHCAKELAEKKKALVRAEKALSRAQAAHQELLSEVARLDMLDRSLKAVNEKTTPPQNIKYIYTYPYWVWTYPSNPGYVTQPQWTFTNTPNLPNGGTFTLGSAQGGYNNGTSGVVQNTVTCTLSNSGPGGIVTSNGGLTLNGVNSCVADLSGGQTAMLMADPNWESNTSLENGTMVVDLTTHAEPEYAPTDVETADDITAELVAKG